MPLGFRDGKILFGAPNQLAVGDPCACCGGVGPCQYCQGFEAAEAVLVTIDGFTNGPLVEPSGDCDILHDCLSLNGSYLLQRKPTLDDMVCEVSNACVYELDYQHVFCTNTGLFGDVRSFGVCNPFFWVSATQIRFGFIRLQGPPESPQCDTQFCQVQWSWFRNFAFGEPKDCINGVYQLINANPDGNASDPPNDFSRCYNFASTCTVQFGA